jgi:hypothetical protein
MMIILGLALSSVVLPLLSALILMPPKRKRGGGGHRGPSHADNTQTNLVPAAPPRLDQLPYTAAAREDATRQDDAALASLRATRDLMLLVTDFVVPSAEIVEGAPSPMVLGLMVREDSHFNSAGQPRWYIDTSTGHTCQVNTTFRNAVNEMAPVDLRGSSGSIVSDDIFSYYEALSRANPPIPAITDPRIETMVAHHRQRYTQASYLVKTVMCLQGQRHSALVAEYDRRKCPLDHYSRLQAGYVAKTAVGPGAAEDYRNLCVYEFGFDPDIRRRTYTTDELEAIVILQNSKNRKIVKTYGFILDAIKREVTTNPETYPQIYPYIKLPLVDRMRGSP